MPVEGTVLDGKYELVELLGRGGMGEVWVAERVGLHRQVAVKFLLHDLADSHDARKRFLAEAKVSGRIDHDNICEVIDLGVDENEALYYVMPLLRGMPLDEVLEREAPFSYERACDVTVQMLAALSSAHKAGIVHRDLKPENIFLTTIGDRTDFVKILDFGIAKALGNTTWKQKEATLTKTGTVLGTPYYMAPEQARGAKDIDGRVDLYSVGVMLYEMLAGVRPVEGESPNEVFWNIWLGTIALPSTHREDLVPEVEEVVMTAMARDRDERYTTADELRDALVEAVVSTGVEIRTSWRPTHSERPRTNTPPSKHLDLEDKKKTPVPKELSNADTLDDEPEKPIERVSLVDPDAKTQIGEETMAEAGLAPRPRSNLLLAGIVVVVLALVTTISYTLMSGNERPAEGPAPRAETSVAGASDLSATREPAEASAETSNEPANEAPSVEVAALVEPHEVLMTLTGVPEGAEITVDGRTVAGPELRLSSELEEVRLAVRADGFELWNRDVPVADGSIVAVALRPFARARRRELPVEARPRPAKNTSKRPDRTRPPVTTFGEMP